MSEDTKDQESPTGPPTGPPKIIHRPPSPAPSRTPTHPGVYELDLHVADNLMDSSGRINWAQAMSEDHLIKTPPPQSQSQGLSPNTAPSVSPLPAEPSPLLPARASRGSSAPIDATEEETAQWESLPGASKVLKLPSHPSRPVSESGKYREQKLAPPGSLRPERAFAPSTLPATSPGVSPATSPGIRRATSPGIAPTTSPGVSPATSPGVAPQTSPGVEPAISIEVEIATSPGVAPRKSPASEDVGAPETPAEAERRMKRERFERIKRQPSMKMDPEAIKMANQLAEIMFHINRAVEQIGEFRSAFPYVIAPNVFASWEGNLKETITTMLREFQALKNPVNKTYDKRFVCRVCKSVFFISLPDGICDECRGKFGTTPI